MRRGILLLLPLLALAGCGKDDLQGEVVSKDVHAGYDYLYTQPIYGESCSGKPMTCRSYQTGVIPIWYHVPTCFQITVHGEKSGQTCIDQSKWEHLAVGDSYVGPDVQAKDLKTKTEH